MKTTKGVEKAVNNIISGTADLLNTPDVNNQVGGKKSPSPNIVAEGKKGIPSNVDFSKSVVSNNGGIMNAPPPKITGWSPEIKQAIQDYKKETEPVANVSVNSGMTWMDYVKKYWYVGVGIVLFLLMRRKKYGR